MEFHREIARNRRATAIVCIAMLLLVFGAVFAFGVLLGTPPTLTLPLAVVLAVFYVVIAYSFSVQAVLAAARARPADPQVREEKLLMMRVEEMAIAAGLPAPKVYVQDSRDINAFATGRRPEEAVVCVTTGALAGLDQEELEGVLAHEMSHVLNRDVLVSTVTVGVVGAVALLAEIALRSLWWGGGARGRGRGGGGHPALVVLALVFLVLAPLFGRLTYLALSRRREYLADATGVRLTRNPEGLAQALEKIRGDLPDDPKGSKTVAGLYIANPWTRASTNSVWSTHPPLEERIRRLRARA